MPTKPKTAFLLLFCLLSVWAINSCKKKPATGIDKELLDKAKDTGSFTWYKHTAAFLPKSENSTHSKPWLRTRFNYIAASLLDSAGKVKPGSVFP